MPSVLSEYWEQPLSNEERRTGFEKIATQIGALHNVGVRQNDFHLGNLLLSEGTLYLIDGGCVEVLNNALSQRDAINNLALFQAVLYPKYDRFLSLVWNAYREQAAASWQDLPSMTFSPAEATQMAGAVCPKSAAQLHSLSGREGQEALSLHRQGTRHTGFAGGSGESGTGYC